MSIQKLIKLKDLLEGRGWIVSDINDNQNLGELTKIKDDCFEWKIKREFATEFIVLGFIFHGPFGNPASSLSELFSCRVKDTDSVLYFTEKSDSDEMQ